MSITAHTTGTTTVFEERDGHSLEFRNIVLTARTSPTLPFSKKADANNMKQILHGVSGHVPPRQVTAVMGPSGSGKTSLLKVLTGRVGAKSNKMELSGRVLLDGSVVDPTNIAVRREIAYVEQEVSIPCTSTPREAIRFSARLRLDRDLSDTAINNLVDEILRELSLEKCADTMIGGGLLMRESLSGGERKRAQCGVELVTRPGILICDEATTGLDSFSAEQFVSVLQRIAKAGASVVLTIHQPPPSVVRQLGHLILLRSGRLVYDGAIGDPLLKFFASKGYAKPADFNVSDWILVSAVESCSFCLHFELTHFCLTVSRVWCNPNHWSTLKRLDSSGRTLSASVQTVKARTRYFVPRSKRNHLPMKGVRELV
ncbi:MAG: hypothetical protein SGILL_005564 [Bacillariaceae sp.]